MTLSNANETVRAVALGSLYGMTFTLLYIDWRLALVSFVAGALGATAELHR